MPEGFVDIKVERWFTVSDDLTGTFKEIAELMRDSVLENFAQGGRPDKWKPLIDGDQRFLYKTGRLRQSLDATYDEQSAEVSTDVPYARPQQEGAHPRNTAQSKKFFWWKFATTKDPKWAALAKSKKPRFTIPPSPFMMFQEEDKTAILEKFRVGIIQFTNADGVPERASA